MRKVLVTALILILAVSAATAQETYFGKNKVRYRDFDWSYIQTRHFDIYFYANGYPVAKFGAEVLEGAYKEISEELNYNLQNRVPVFVYNSHNDMQQTNITSGLLSEGIGGFTESFKNRITIPFTGSYEDFRHVLHHELTHAVTNDMLIGGKLSSLISRNRLFNLPHWFAEGYAEYSSWHGWDYNTDMWMRDATINNYLIPPEYLEYNYFAYRQGQAMVKYIVDEYGEDKLHKILQKGKIMLSLNKAIETVLGVKMEDFWEGFSKEMKRRYWPSIATLKEPKEFSKQLTKAREDGSYFNEKPVYSPDGDKIAMFTDRSDYTEIVLISPYDGKLIRRLVKAQRSGDLESLHAWVSGLSFSPDGNQLVFVAKSNGKESLFFVDVAKGEIIKRVHTEFNNMLDPSWSPDGKKIAFAALYGPKRDIYTYDVETEQFEQITDDRYDDVEPSWLHNSTELIFASDRPHPGNPAIDSEGHPYVNSVQSFMPGNFVYGMYNIFRLDVAHKRVTPVNVGPGQNRLPQVSPEGNSILFISNRSGIDNIYIAALDTTEYYAVTNVLTGIAHASWSPTGDKIVFSSYSKGAYDIFVLDDLVPTGERGVLPETGFVKGDYDREVKPEIDFAAATEEEKRAEAAVEPIEEETEVVDSTAAPTELASTTGTDEPAEDTGEPTTADSTATASNAEAPADTTVTVVEEPAADTTEIPLIPTVRDTTTVKGTDSTGVIPEVPTDTVKVEETGIYGDEYVYRGTVDETALDSVLQEVRSENDTGPAGFRKKEPAAFDSIPPRMASGEYQIKRYKAKLTTDYVGGGFSYDTFFGVQGQTVFIFSDYLGNHQLYVATSIVNSLDQSFLQAVYINGKRRTSLGVGGFHTKNYYEDTNNFLFSDRFYGVQGFASYPFSLFSRVEATVSQVFIDRKYYDKQYGDTRENRSSEVTTLNGAYVFDNVLWGNTGPVNGRRVKLMVDAGANLFDSHDITFYSVGADYRKYWHLDPGVSMAIRLSGGASFGATPKQYFLGGTTNYIGNVTVEAKVYDVENLYFSDVVTPLRGQDYYGLSGDRYALLNWELRFPMIQYFAMKYPLPLVLGNITGAVFYDMGATWFGSDFKGGTSEGGRDRLEDIKTGFGLGMRMNLFGWALLRYDLAWATDFYDVSAHPTSYFSFGADF